jgi:hypothetical protein
MNVKYFAPKSRDLCKKYFENSQRLHKSVQPFFFFLGMVKGAKI